MRQLLRTPLAGSLASCALIVAMLPTASASVTAVEREVARAYARDGNTLLYTETHWRYRDQGIGRRLVVYRCPDGAAFARKIVVDRPSAIAPDFEFVDARSGYREGVRRRGGQREVFVQTDRNSVERSKPLPTQADGIIDAGFDAGVRQHWRELGGEGLRLAFLVPERFNYAPVRLVTTQDVAGNGPRVRRLRMTLDRWFGFVVPPISLTYASDDQRLLEFAGPGTIRDARGRSRDVRIVFPQAAPVEEVQVSAEMLRLDAMLPLPGRCRV